MRTLRSALAVALLICLCGCSVPSKVVNIYFFKGEKLESVTRDLPTNEGPVVIAIDQLLRGPNEQELAAGYATEIPDGTRARNVEVHGDTAIVDFNHRLAEYGGGSAKVEGLIAQIVYTATSVHGVRKIILKLEGSDQFTLGGEGYMIDHPLEKRDVKI